MRISVLAGPVERARCWYALRLCRPEPGVRGSCSLGRGRFCFGLCVVLLGRHLRSANGFTPDLGLNVTESIPRDINQDRDLAESQRARLLQAAEAYVATVVRGVVTREHDEFTGERPGRLERSSNRRRSFE